MKKILLFMCLVSCLATYAQDVKFDTLAGTAYVYIEAVPWVRKEVPATRLYVGIVNYQLTYAITIMWQIRGAIQIDPTTVNTVVLSSGQYQIVGKEFAKWDKSDGYLFNLIANLHDVDVTISK